MKIKGKKLEMLHKVDVEIMDELKMKLGMIGTDQAEKEAMHMMKDRVD